MSSIIYIFLVDEKDRKNTLTTAFIVLFNQTVALNIQSPLGNFINVPNTFQNHILYLWFLFY